MSEKAFQVIYHPVYLTDYPTASCENPSRIEAIMAVLGKHYRVIEPEPASERDILLVHTRSIVQSVRMDADVFEASLIAAGGAILAADLAMEGRPSFAAVRPPGHHASPASHWGFCFFNNVAISVERLIRKGFIGQALILDIDLHFGDGTDRFFAGRKDVVVANIQEEFRDAFLRKVDLALSRNEYDMVAVSAGFDRHVRDWGGTLTTEDYFTIGRSVRDHAMSNCNGRYFAVLEGGYNIDVLGENALALCHGMDQ